MTRSLDKQILITLIVISLQAVHLLDSRPSDDDDRSEDVLRGDRGREVTEKKEANYTIFRDQSCFRVVSVIHKYFIKS